MEQVIKQIWKFQLEPKNVQGVIMPIGAEILTANTQKGTVCIWCMVNPRAEREERVFEIYGTGHDIYADAGLKYIGIFFSDNDAFVGHLFERVKE